VVKQVGLVILVLGLAVTGPGFRDKIGPDDDVVPSSHPAIRPFRAALTHSFVTIVERHTGDHVASVDEEVAGVFARVRSRITPNQRPATPPLAISVDAASMAASARGQGARRPVVHVGG